MPPFVVKIFILSIFEWPFYTGFTVYQIWIIHVNEVGKIATISNRIPIIEPWHESTNTMIVHKGKTQVNKVSILSDQSLYCTLSG